jgi:hypothetical protein
MTNPMIQIDDEVREMTDEEYAEYQAEEAAYTVPPAL